MPAETAACSNGQVPHARGGVAPCPKPETLGRILASGILCIPEDQPEEIMQASRRLGQGAAAGRRRGIPRARMRGPAVHIQASGGIRAQAAACCRRARRGRRRRPERARQRQPAARQAYMGVLRCANMAENSGDAPGPIIGELPEGLDDETREWVRKVVNMNDEDARKAMLERSFEMEIKNAWSRSHEEFLKELP